MKDVPIKRTHSSAVPGRSDRKPLSHDRAEALLVLDYARQMVEEFLDNSSGVSDNIQLSFLRH